MWFLFANVPWRCAGLIPFTISSVRLFSTSFFAHELNAIHTWAQCDWRLWRRLGFMLHQDLKLRRHAFHVALYKYWEEWDACKKATTDCVTKTIAYSVPTSGFGWVILRSNTSDCTRTERFRELKATGPLHATLLSRPQSAANCALYAKSPRSDVRIWQYEVCKNNDKETLLEERKNLRLAMADQAYHLKLHKE